MIFCHDKREYMTLGEYMEKYPIAYAEAVESMTAEQKALFAARFEDRYIYLPKDDTSDTCENFSISTNVTNVTPDADNPESISAGGTAYWKYTVDSDAEDPVIAVTGCEWIAPAGGIIFLFNPTGNITITVSASLKYYTVTTQGENCSFTPSSGKIQARGSLQVFIHPATNYKWNGTLTVTGATAIKNVSGGYITLLNPTGAVTVSATCDRIVYPLTVSGINCTPNPKPTQIAAGGTLAITYTAAAGYDLPEASGVGVTGCSFGWNQSTGVLTLYNPTGAVAACAVAVAKSYAITATVTNGTATGANVIHTGETVALTIAANTGYNLPDTVTVTGASQTWNKETGTLTLSNPTGAVTVSAVCVAASYTLEAGTYKWVDNPSDPGVTIKQTFNSGVTGYVLTSNNTYSSAQFDILYIQRRDPSDTGFTNSIYIPFSGYHFTYYHYAGNWIGTWTCGNGDEDYTATDTNKLRTIIVKSNQTVSADFYNWAITGGNLVKQTGETWVLNSSLTNSALSKISVNFQSSGNAYVDIERYYDDEYEEGLRYYTSSSGSQYDLVYANQGSGGEFFDQAYRTITFSQPVNNPTLLAWLQANGTKQ